MQYTRLAFIVNWNVEGAGEFAGEFEVPPLPDDELAAILRFDSPEELRPAGKLISKEGIQSLGKAFGIAVDPEKYTYLVEELGINEG